MSEVLLSLNSHIFLNRNMCFNALNIHLKLYLALLEPLFSSFSSCLAGHQMSFLIDLSNFDSMSWYNEWEWEYGI